MVEDKIVVGHTVRKDLIALGVYRPGRVVDITDWEWH